jgi:hypothetical protein
MRRVFCAHIFRECVADTVIDLGLAQILPMYDDDTGAEPKIVSASFADPFVLLLRDDSSIFVAQCDDNNELEEIEREDDTLLATKWLTGCLYTDLTGVFAGVDTAKGRKAGENVVMFLLSAGGALHVSLGHFVTRRRANCCRSMPCLIFRRPSTLPRGCVSCRPYFQQTMLPEDPLLARLSQRYWLLTSATLSQNRLTSLYVPS